MHAPDPSRRPAPRDFGPPAVWGGAARRAAGRDHGRRPAVVALPPIAPRSTAGWFRPPEEVPASRSPSRTAPAWPALPGAACSDSVRVSGAKAHRSSPRTAASCRPLLLAGSGSARDVPGRRSARAKLRGRAAQGAVARARVDRTHWRQPARRRARLARRRPGRHDRRRLRRRASAEPPSRADQAETAATDRVRRARRAAAKRQVPSGAPRRRPRGPHPGTPGEQAVPLHRAGVQGARRLPTRTSSRSGTRAATLTLPRPT